MNPRPLHCERSFSTPLTRCHSRSSLVEPLCYLSAPHTTSHSISVKTRKDTRSNARISDNPRLHTVVDDPPQTGSALRSEPWTCRLDVGEHQRPSANCERDGLGVQWPKTSSSISRASARCSPSDAAPATHRRGRMRRPRRVRSAVAPWTRRRRGTPRRGRCDRRIVGPRPNTRSRRSGRQIGELWRVA